MDPKYSGEMLKHLEKQNDLLMEAYRSMSHELHKLQVEEEMLMRKFYDIMENQSLKKEKCDFKTVSKNVPKIFVKSPMHIMDETIKKFQCWKFSVFGESKDAYFEEDVTSTNVKLGDDDKGTSNEQGNGDSTLYTRDNNWR